MYGWLGNYLTNSCSNCTCWVSEHCLQEVNKAATLTYVTSGSPIIDTSFLAKAARDLCSGIKTYWLYPHCSDNSGSPSNKPPYDTYAPSTGNSGIQATHRPCHFIHISQDPISQKSLPISSCIWVFIYFCLSIYLSVCLSIYLSIYRHLSICLSVCLSVRPSVRPSIHSSIHPSIHSSIHPSIHLSI